MSAPYLYRGFFLLVTKKRNCKRLILRVKDATTVAILTPHRTPQFFVEKFFDSSYSFIQERVSFFVSKQQKEKSSSREEYLIHKEEARRLITERVVYFSSLYGFSYKKISIRNTKTRWGSCSSSGSLSFHYKLLFLPPSVRDYVIVHELCHTKEMNHSNAFWALVEGISPDYRISKKYLKEYSLDN
jgi:predicted metal-dependent hydrolase